MDILVINKEDLNFELVVNAEVTERVFAVSNTVNGVVEDHIVMVHVDKKQTDVDGDGTIDTLDGKFCLSLIDINGEPVLVNGKPVNVSQVHSVNVEAINDGSINLVDWISEISATLMQVVVNKKSTLIGWGSI